MSQPLQQWLQQLQLLQSQQRSIDLPFDPIDSTFQHLQRQLSSSSSIQTDHSTIVKRTISNTDRSWTEFIILYLNYVQRISLSTDDDHYSNEYTLLVDCYKLADRIFAQPDSTWFVPTLKNLTKRLIKVSILTGRKSGDAKLTKAGQAARMLARPMGIAASDRSTESPCKRDALYFLANQTFLVYFSLKNLRLCDTVLNNTNQNTIPLEKYSKRDQCEFLYYRGRLSLYQRRLASARRDLKKCFQICFEGSWKNARLILIYLITSSLPLGYFPSLDLLKQFDLYHQFGTMLQPLKKGNFQQVLHHLNEYRDFHLKHGNYLLLREKLEVLSWRNLVRQTLLITTNGSPLPPSGPPTLSLATLTKGAQMMFGMEIDKDDVECMCTSLIEQGYLKAYILHSKRILVLQKGLQFGFPPVSSVQ